MEQQNRPKMPRLRKYVFLITYAIVLFIALYRLDSVWLWLKWAWKICTPAILGIALSYLFYLPTHFFQYKVLGFLSNKPRLKGTWRGFAMLLAYLSVLLCLAGLLALILPRAIDSITMLATNFSSYFRQFQIWADGFLSSLSVNPDIADAVTEFWDSIILQMQAIISRVLSILLNTTLSFTSGFINFTVSLMISFFVVYNQETLATQFRRLFQTLFGSRATKRALTILDIANTVFSQFILGKIAEAIILGLLCFIGMTLFRMDYALLISTIIAITNTVPIIGPWVGAISCTIILLVVNPMQALWFLVFVVVLQQLENSVVYPRVIGNAVGLPGLWVLVSVMLGGALFGMWGMLLGTPIAAVMYQLLGEWLDKREKEGLSPLPK